MKVVIKEGFDSLEQIKQLFLEYANGLEYSLDFQDFEAEIEHLPYKYAKPEGNLFIAKIKGEAVGCVAYKNLGNGICEMKRLYVKPQYRRFGIGKKHYSDYLQLPPVEKRINHSLAAFWKDDEK